MRRAFMAGHVDSNRTAAGAVRNASDQARVAGKGKTGFLFAETHERGATVTRGEARTIDGDFAARDGGRRRDALNARDAVFCVMLRPGRIS